MPTSTRTLGSHYIADETIPASAFIPRYTSEAAMEAVRKGGDVGRRGFNCPQYSVFNPFLALSDITVGPPLLFPEHPHCGHEMFLYVIDGEFTHEDFMGCKVTASTGDVHWMTTGRGIIHAQIPAQHGPASRHVQIWINLPKEMKQCEPGNQVMRSESTPVIRKDTAELRLLVGQYEKHCSPIKSVTSVLLMDIHVHANEKLTLTLPGPFFTGVYVLSGSGEIGSQTVTSFSVATSQAGTEEKTILVCQAASSGLRFILYAGTPLADSLDVDGYFTCASSEDTKQALTDFEGRKGTFARGKDWSASIVQL